MLVTRLCNGRVLSARMLMPVSVPTRFTESLGTQSKVGGADWTDPLFFCVAIACSVVFPGCFSFFVPVLPGVLGDAKYKRAEGLRDLAAAAAAGRK